MPGDISIKGDTQETHYHYGPPVQPTTAPTGTVPTSTSPATPIANVGAKRCIIPALACCLGLPMGAAGGAAIYQYFANRAPAVIQSVNNLGIKPGIHVSGTP